MDNSLDNQTYYSVKHPGLWVLLTDEEEESINQINRFVNNCIQENYIGKGAVDRCYIHVIGINGVVHRLFSGYLSDLEDNPIEILETVKKVPDSNGRFVEINCKVPIWCKRYEVRKEKRLLEALKSIIVFLNEWILGNPNSPIPVVWYVSSELVENFNVSSEIKNAINDIKAMKCKDGKVLYCNVFSSLKNDVLLDERYSIVQLSSHIPHGQILDNFRYWADSYTNSVFRGDSPQMSFNLSVFDKLFLPIMGYLSEPYFKRV